MHGPQRGDLEADLGHTVAVLQRSEGVSYPSSLSPIARIRLLKGIT